MSCGITNGIEHFRHVNNLYSELLFYQINHPCIIHNTTKDAWQLQVNLFLSIIFFSLCGRHLPLKQMKWQSPNRVNRREEKKNFNSEKRK